MHAGVRLGSQWTARRKPCVQGPLRRAHPASGATWNVQVVRGKVTSKCLWHACRALSLGLLLMVLGAAMAIIGYYADHLSVGQEIRGNATVKVKNESRGFHLNNLSYAGPIVMGVGGFIVVAACVMTFEARDSAAKVMPARLKGTVVGLQSRQAAAAAAARRCASSQTTNSGRWDHHLGVFRSSPTASDRRALTAAFLQFSQHLSDKRLTNLRTSSQRPLLVDASGASPSSTASSGQNKKGPILRCGSVPNLGGRHRSPEAEARLRAAALGRDASPKDRLRCQQQQSLSQKQQQSHGRGHLRGQPYQQRHQRYHHTHPVRSGCALLNPAMLQRQALSVDETHVRYSRESLAGSQCSMAMDLHLPCEGPVTLRVRDRSKHPRPTSGQGQVSRSDTARKHTLARQRQINDDEAHAEQQQKQQNAQNSQRTRDTHSCSPNLPSCQTSSVHESIQTTRFHHRSISNASDPLCTRRFGVGGIGGVGGAAGARRDAAMVRSASVSPQSDFRHDESPSLSLARRRRVVAPPTSLDVGSGGDDATTTTTTTTGDDEEDVASPCDDRTLSEYHTIADDVTSTATVTTISSPTSKGAATGTRHRALSPDSYHTICELPPTIMSGGGGGGSGSATTTADYHSVRDSSSTTGTLRTARDDDDEDSASATLRQGQQRDGDDTSASLAGGDLSDDDATATPTPPPLDYDVDISDDDDDEVTPTLDDDGLTVVDAAPPPPPPPALASATLGDKDGV